MHLACQAGAHAAEICADSHVLPENTGFCAIPVARDLGCATAPTADIFVTYTRATDNFVAPGSVARRSTVPFPRSLRGSRPLRRLVGVFFASSARHGPIAARVHR